MIRVLLVSPPRRELFEGIGYGADGVDPVRFDIRIIESGDDVETTIARFWPHVILTFSPESSSHPIEQLPAEVRRRWVNLPFGVESNDRANQVIMQMYVDVVRHRRLRGELSFSVVTATYNTGPVILRAYDSLRQQTYRNWEWVIYDDSTESHTLSLVNHLASHDSRIKVVRAARHSGWIGAVKRRAFRAAEGDVLVELDHDDELTNDCLASLAEGFEAHPECGFAYTDFAEVHPDGSPVKYGDTFAFGFGSYYEHSYQGRRLLVASSPAINTTTMGHIVGVPNHARAWTRDAYERCGGHSPEVFVADDYEVLLRTFLTTRMLRVGRLGYIQHRSATQSNTHVLRNAEIQRQVQIFSGAYRREVEARAREIVGPDPDDLSRVPLHVEHLLSAKGFANVA